jgi:hypothetical protein
MVTNWAAGMMEDTVCVAVSLIARLLLCRLATDTQVHPGLHRPCLLMCL